jgi:hypothetical protein
MTKDGAPEAIMGFGISGLRGWCVGNRRRALSANHSLSVRHVSGRSERTAGYRRIAPIEPAAALAFSPGREVLDRCPAS